MYEKTAVPEEAKIHFLHIPPPAHEGLRRIINRIWFFYKIEYIESAQTTENLIKTYQHPHTSPVIDLVFADFRAESELTSDQISELISSLHQIRTPLISLADIPQIQIYDQNKNWLHISLPPHQLNKNLNEITNSITNFWFCLPSKK